MGTPVVVGLNAVIVAVTEETPRILTVLPSGETEREEEEALPVGPLRPEEDRTLELGVRRLVREQAGLELGYVEQLYTFGDRYRDPGERTGGPRLITVAYLALVREVRPAAGREACWQDGYEYFPWEDWRRGRPAVIDGEIVPTLRRWVEAAPSPTGRRERQERVEITFGLGGASWDGERVLERYELLYEVGLVTEAWRDAELLRPPEGRRKPASRAGPGLGRSMVGDHRRILATALGRLRGKLKYRPVVFELVPPTFTLLQLQRVVEALAGVRLHKQNFRRLVEKGGLVEGTGRVDARTGGRPAELFRFRREVLHERPAPGVGLPGLGRGGG